MEHNEAGDMKKGYDKEIIRRLFTYAKPYLAWIAFSLVLLVGVVGVELLRPILIGSAVDDMISKYDEPYAMVDENEKGAIPIEDIYVIQDKKNERTDAKKARIVYDETYERPYFF